MNIPDVIRRRVLQANLLAVLAQCGRGGEVILGDEAHIFHYEGGGISALGGCVMHTVCTPERLPELYCADSNINFNLHISVH